MRAGACTSGARQGSFEPIGKNRLSPRMHERGRDRARRINASGRIRPERRQGPSRILLEGPCVRSYDSQRAWMLRVERLTEHPDVLGQLGDQLVHSGGDQIDPLLLRSSLHVLDASEQVLVVGLD